MDLLIFGVLLAIILIYSLHWRQLGTGKLHIDLQEVRPPLLPMLLYRMKSHPIDYYLPLIHLPRLMHVAKPNAEALVEIRIE